MTYILFVIFLNHTAQIGPFPGVFPCEKAAAQVTAAAGYQRPRVRTVCINLQQKALHWNGKELPK